MASREKWESLTSDQKTKVIQDFCKKVGLGENFNYDKEIKVLSQAFECGVSFKSPIITLEIIDPMLAHSLMSWMFTKVEYPDGSKDTVPLFGYNAIELTFDKTQLTGYSEEERAILNSGIEILRRKGVVNG